MGFFDFFTEDIAIDLGTANTLIIHNDKVVVDQPSIVATDIKSGKVIAVGNKAQQMHGKAHRAIESITLDRVEAHLKDEVMPKYAETIYNGLWFSSAGFGATWKAEQIKLKIPESLEEYAFRDDDDDDTFVDEKDEDEDMDEEEEEDTDEMEDDEEPVKIVKKKKSKE